MKIVFLYLGAGYKKENLPDRTNKNGTKLLHLNGGDENVSKTIMEKIETERDKTQMLVISMPHPASLKDFVKAYNEDEEMRKGLKDDEFFILMDLEANGYKGKYGKSDSLDTGRIILELILLELVDIIPFVPIALPRNMYTCENGMLNTEGIDAAMTGITQKSGICLDTMIVDLKKDDKDMCYDMFQGIQEIKELLVYVEDREELGKTIKRMLFFFEKSDVQIVKSTFFMQNGKEANPETIAQAMKFLSRIEERNTIVPSWWPEERMVKASIIKALKMSTQYNEGRSELHKFRLDGKKKNFVKIQGGRIMGSIDTDKGTYDVSAKKIPRNSYSCMLPTIKE